MDSDTKAQLVAWLDARFGHRDFTLLNKKWKKVYFEAVANEILLMIEHKKP